MNIKITSDKGSIASIGINVDPITSIIEKYKEQRDIIVTKTIFSCQSFSFKTVGRDEIVTKLKNLMPSKATKESDVPTKFAKEYADLFPDSLLSFFSLLCTKRKFFVLPQKD